ncbi:MAG: TrmH family RNA methyltransferase [Planctomycetota bacterium]
MTPARRPRRTTGARPAPPPGIRRGKGSAPGPTDREPGRHRRADEEVYHGVRACQALFARRPDDIVRVYLAAGRRADFADLLGWCARSRRGFQIVEEENLGRLTGSIHHEGIAIVARAARRLGLAELRDTLTAGQRRGPIVHLDGVHNPHNLGSILRSAAHFGAAAVSGRSGDLPAVSPAAARVAQGAADAVPLCDFADVAADLAVLRGDGWVIVGTSSHRGDPYRARPLPLRTVIVLGSEGQGMSPEIEPLLDRCLRIPGTGAVESLNVAVACGILLAEWSAAHADRPPQPGGPGRRRP